MQLTNFHERMRLSNRVLENEKKCAKKILNFLAEVATHVQVAVEGHPNACTLQSDQIFRVGKT